MHFKIPLPSNPAGEGFRHDVRIPRIGSEPAHELLHAHVGIPQVEAFIDVFGDARAHDRYSSMGSWHAGYLRAPAALQSQPMLGGIFHHRPAAGRLTVAQGVAV